MEEKKSEDVKTYKIEDPDTGEEVEVIPKSQLDETKTLLDETKDKLGKLENKDYNWKKLRDMNKEEKDKLSATELRLLQQQEQLEENQKSFTTRIVKSYEDEALAVLCGDDAELIKKVQYNYGRIKDEVVEKDKIYSKMKDAYNMTATNRQPNPLMRAVGYQGRNDYISPAQPKVEFSGDEKDLASKLGLSGKELEDYKKRKETI